ncbi:MAG: hypothetical protein Q9160_001191 [Pyrenula sp. 1 TL-2023]
MGDRGQRIPETLRRLVLSFLPRQLPGEDDDASADRIEDAFDRTQSIVDSYASQSPPDVNQVQELIQRKLLRENESPANAAKFNNFYSKLLSIPVVKEKWSLLFFLYSLSTLVDKEIPMEDPLQGGNHPEIARLRENLQRRRDLRHSASPISAARSDRKPDGQQHEGGNGFPSQNGKFKGQPDRGGASQTQREIDSLIDEKTHFDDGDPRYSPAESVLLRDLPYNLQGLSSENLKFTSPASIKLPQTLPVPLLSLLHTLAEPCLLYRQLSDFTAGSSGGLVSQSLRAAVSVELRSHLTLVASLEGEIRRSLAAVEKQESLAVRKAAVTLRRCVVWTRDATMGLRLLSLVVEESKEKRGGQIISLVHSFSSSHGDPFVAAYAERLLTHVTRPFYDMLRQWIYDGELTDPFHEFFVIEQDPNRRPEVDPRKVSTSVWEDKFKLDDSMVPSIIFSDFAKKVFLIGKSLNFIRHNCSDSDWVNEYSRSASRELRYGDTETLESSIDEAYKTTMTRLISLMSHKYHVFTHLEALKKYMLISQGDFITLLIESLAIHLDRPANAQYRHVLNSQLEHAIRHSNAQYDDEEVLKRLDARIMALSSGDIAWEAFTLEYKITAPCDVIITQWANTQYLRVFNLLWRIKRVEFSLSSTWRRSMTGSRGILAAVNDRVGPDWKRARCVMSEMIHFVNQLLYYVLFEVIESSWEKLQEAISKPESTLDDLIAAHNDYLNEITSKGLLSTQARSQERNHLNQIYEIFKIMLGYKDAVDTLYSFSVAEFTRRQEFSARIEQRTAQGRWGITESDMLRGDSKSSGAGTPVMTERPRSSRMGTFPLDETDSPLLPPTKVASADDRVLDGLRVRMSSLSTDFRKAISVFLGDLARQPDVDVRFLGVVMNFNDVYKPVHLHRSKRSSTARSH